MCIRDSSDRDARDKKTESTRPATGNQAAAKGNHRSRSHLKAAEPVSYTHLDVYKRQDILCPAHGHQAQKER